MPAMFTRSLVENLNLKSQLQVVEGRDNDIIEPNKVYIAPGGKHMIVSRTDLARRINILDTPPINSCKPSVDVLFLSLPNVYTGNILAVIMTGMGTDGLNGVRELKNISSYCITQSEDSCVVYGMPKSIIDAGLSNESVHLDELASRVTQIIKG
jgi:two-component system chemotaxis response regulator CheB